MPNPKYNNTQPFAYDRNTNVNFNYVWDEPTQHWIPQQDSTLSLNYVLNNAKDFINKFGNNPNVSQSVSLESPESVWDGSSSYIFPPDIGTGIQVKSDSSSDLQDIVIEGLDENFEQKKWSGTLNGLSSVNVDGLWARVFRAYNNDSFGISGIVNIHASGSDSLSYAKIINGNNQTLMSLYTIPANCVGYLVQYQATAHNPQSSSEIGYTLQMKTREFGKAFRVKSITSAGTSHEVTKEFKFPNLLPSRADIIFDIVGSNGNNGSVDVEFNIALI